jgi:hypothetical protein
MCEDIGYEILGDIGSLPSRPLALYRCLRPVKEYA